MSTTPTINLPAWDVSLPPIPTCPFVVVYALGVGLPWAVAE